MKLLRVHPIVADQPAMSAERFEAFKLEIAAAGQLKPIVLLGGRILDGRHRYRACVELGVEPAFEEYDAARWGDPASWAFSIDSTKALTPGQEAASVLLFADRMPVAKRRGDGKLAELLAARRGIRPRTIEKAMRVRRVDPEAFAAMASGKLNVEQAHARARRAERARKVRRLRRGDDAGAGRLDVRVGDCLAELAKLDEGSVDVAFADPPYNQGWRYAGDATGDRRGDAEFLDWCARWALGCLRALRPGGSLFVVMSSRYAPDLWSCLSLADGLARRSFIVWHETFGPHSESALADCWRAVLWFSKGDDGFAFNMDVREPSARQTLYADKRAQPDGKLVTNVWTIARQVGTGKGAVPWAKDDKDGCPPQLPLELVERCLRLSARPGDLVVDPFFGNGTTGVAATLAGLRCVGIEQSKSYARRAEQWVASEAARVAAERAAAAAAAAAAVPASRDEEAAHAA